MKVEILYEEDDFLIVNKPAGILSQKASANDLDISSLLNKNLRIDFLAPVHRLDRNTSGCIILAKKSKSANYLSEIIKNKELEKKYLLICKGSVKEEGIIDLPIRKIEHKNICQINSSGQPAQTLYTKIDTKSNISLVSATILTGRPHQVRIHFSHIGHPILGDKKYAKKPWSEVFSRQALHAYKIKFTHPMTKNTIDVSATIPEDLQELVKRYQLELHE
ncbi:MAG: RluA family pseudouridine synthase [Oligoflexia bacterium]|nr:RluA family pseudouridine synthase [Oligoflexia bacterium]